uniref:Cyclin N-terminal domain-containing protein n=1 Tax=Oryza meridionalis TaxID=40149 RepID=A0A0E0BZX1_9ORYZ
MAAQQWAMWFAMLLLRYCRRAGGLVFSRFHELAASMLKYTAYYLNRYLPATPESDVALQLRLVGATAVFLAAKYKNQYTLRKIDANMAVARCGYTSETRHKMVSIMETEILAALDYNLGGPTACTFVEHFTRYYGEGKEEKLVKQATHRVTDGTMLTYGFHRYLPSVVAVSVIFLARSTGYTAPQARLCRLPGSSGGDMAEKTSDELMLGVWG